MAEQDLDRNEAATPFKLKKARDEGKVPKSPDTVSVIVFLTAVTFFYWQGWPVLEAQFRFDQALLIQAGRTDPSFLALWGLVERMVMSSVKLFAPFFIAIMLAAIIGNLIQTGPIFTFKPIQADIDRINPMNGFKRIFSMRIIFDAFRSCIKLTLLSIVVYYALKSLTPQFYNLANISPLGYVDTLLKDFASIGFKIGLMLVVIALIDYAYTQREFSKKMRMSKRDVKDEVKHREGDPRIRARLRELRQEMLKRSLAMRQTRNADVLITNPTHIAVALRYQHGEMESPQLIAKGAGSLAAAMRQIAARHNIPVVQNRTLARKLFHQMEFQQHVPPDMYAEVARIIVWVFAMRDAKNAAAGGAR